MTTQESILWMPAKKISGQTSVTMICGFKCEHYVDTALNYFGNITLLNTVNFSLREGCRLPIPLLNSTW